MWAGLFLTAVLVVAISISGVFKESYTDKLEAIRSPVDNTLMIEHAQRNSILKGLNDAEENDLIIVSDVDEIPNLEANNLYKNKSIKTTKLLSEKTSRTCTGRKPGRTSSLLAKSSACRLHA